jgi:hypothetical protein
MSRSRGFAATVNAFGGRENHIPLRSVAAGDYAVNDSVLWLATGGLYLLLLTLYGRDGRVPKLI